MVETHVPVQLALVGFRVLDLRETVVNQDCDLQERVRCRHLLNLDESDSEIVEELEYRNGLLCCQRRMRPVRELKALSVPSGYSLLLLLYFLHEHVACLQPR